MGDLKIAAWFSKRITFISYCLLLLFSISGCSATALVTGLDGMTRGAPQSETAAATSFYGGVHRIVVAYNDDTGYQPTIQYGPSSRKTLRGASLMGWSYSEDRGATWKYGGKLTPPQGWVALWGDPGLTTSQAHYNMVFMSNLAMPDSKFPAAGVDGGADSALGGACIARSLDGGIHFAHFQCIANTDPVPGRPSATSGHFYDGGSMASGPQGDVYTAYVDIDTSQIDVWRTPDGTQPFTRLPPPFPNYYVASHARIRVGRDGTLFVMAVLKLNAEQNTYLLAANRYRDGRWLGSTSVASPVQVYPNVDLGTSLSGSQLRVRTGPQFSFDIGTSSADRDDSIRFMYTTTNSHGWLYIRGGICDYALRSCGWYAGWTFGASEVGPRDTQRLDVFNPNVSAFPGFLFGIAPRWQGSFLTRYGNQTTTLNLTRATLGYIGPTPFSIPVDIARNVPVCSDTRGYWGDYDDFLPVQVDGDRIRFMRFMTDSSLGCTKRWQFTAETQHVGAVDYWY